MAGRSTLFVHVYRCGCLGRTEIGTRCFPVVDAGQFRLRMRAPDGTHIEKSEALAKQALRLIGEELGPANIELTLGYVGMIHSNFPVNAVYQWSRGPEEAILYVDLSDNLHLPDEVMKGRVRERLAKEMPEVRFSFEPSDIVNEVMSFGSPTPIEVVVSGSDFAKNREFAEKLRKELAQVLCFAIYNWVNRWTTQPCKSTWIARRLAWQA